VMTLNDLPEVCTVDEVAPLLRLNRKTLFDAIKAGTFPGKKIGKRVVIYKAALIDFLSSSNGVLPKRG